VIDTYALPAIYIHVTKRIMNNLNAFINVKDANDNPADYNIQYTLMLEKYFLNRTRFCLEVEFGNHINTTRDVVLSKSRLSIFSKM
jgi:hypothetical protein